MKRLSMKLLYELRGDYLMEFSKESEEYQAQVMLRTIDFLRFVDKKLKPHSPNPS